MYVQTLSKEGFNRHLGKTIALMMNKSCVDALSWQRKVNVGAQEKQGGCDALRVAICLRPCLLMVCLKFTERGYKIKKQTAPSTRVALRKVKVREARAGVWINTG